MGQVPLVGPATEYIAGELRAQQARMGWTLDEIAAMSDVGRATVNRALKGKSAIAIETLLALGVGMGLDPIALIEGATKRR